MSERIKNETDETITIEPGETIKVISYKEKTRVMSRRPVTHKIKKVFEDW